MSSENSDEVKTTVKTSGRVKWFNNSSGYGFITATDGDKTGEDVFVHHSALNTEEQQYNYLVLGEYVEFGWAEVTDKETHQWQASSVTGINGGKLMCETHKEQRLTNEDSSRRPRNNDGNLKSRPRQKYQGGEQSVTDDTGKVYMLVPKSESR
jgi:CspA family cold shock protein